MAVEHPEAPRREHEQPRAGEEDAHKPLGQRALLPLEAHRDAVDEQRRGEHADEHQHRDDEREQGEDGPGDAVGLLLVVLRKQARVDGDKGGRERALAKDVL
jgi:hypothetical protein